MERWKDGKMERWRVKDFSKMTGVSVRTLHYYDEIGLLNPSERQVSGVRLYGKENIHDLLLILSLRFLKFKLMTIKSMREKIIPIREEFIAQDRRLIKEIDRLVKATKILEDIVKVTKTSSLDIMLTLVKIYYAMQYLESILRLF